MLDQIKSNNQTIQFQEVIAFIDENYTFDPCAFLNGELENSIGQNSGSCKLLQFALIENLTLEQTLQCFGEYYRTEVLQNPDGTNHQNIRNLMRFGLQGLKFEAFTLIKK
ncbi:MAG: HopJ type III effector protein [Leadbetterella sp.]